ncbi:MAG TPA: hypothetical protein VGC17_06515, partial [Lactovum miscens]
EGSNDQSEESEGSNERRVESTTGIHQSPSSLPYFRGFPIHNSPVLGHLNRGEESTPFFTQTTQYGGESSRQMPSRVENQISEHSPFYNDFSTSHTRSTPTTPNSQSSRVQDAFSVDGPRSKPFEFVRVTPGTPNIGKGKRRGPLSEDSRISSQRVRAVRACLLCWIIKCQVSFTVTHFININLHQSVRYQ